MAEFNKIYSDSSIIVSYEPSATLCFNNGKVISKSKFALEDHTLTLFEDTADTVSVFYNNGIANTYEFDTRLYQDNVQLSTIDKYENRIENLNKNSILVFIDGILEPASNYTVIEGNRLVILNKKTNDNNKIFHIIVYSSNIGITRLTNPEFKTKVSNGITDSNTEYNIETNYSPDKVMVFVNGIKVGFNCIEYFKDTPITENGVERKANIITLNIPETLEEIKSVEVVNLFNSMDNTKSLNFVTRQGYLTYGPFDDLGNKIPNKYDTIITFTDQAKLAIDNIRTGFIFRENEGTGKILITSDNFESTELRGLTLERFKYTSYTKDAYYCEVPNTTNIVKYLSEYDKKYSFLPEILNIFQRVLLDEINDTIERLRQARSISRVDSISINKLISLLGFNLNIKRLNKKQRRELLEELTEFYRVAGTRSSYNLVNILQNNLKLIDMQQLFTIYGQRPDNISTKQTIYSYDVQLLNGGSGYQDGDVLKADGFPIEGKVSTEGGSVVEFTPTTKEGYRAIEGGVAEFDLISASVGVTNVKSTIASYDYHATLNEDNYGYVVGQTLTTDGSLFALEITEVDENGKILNFELIPNTGSTALVLKNAQLYVDFKNAKMDISSARNVNDFDPNDTENFPIYSYIDPQTGQEKRAEWTTGGQAFSETLPAGEYIIIMSGGGGAGAASDSTTGSTNDTYAENGFAGEYIQRTLILKTSTKITGKVGQGGGKVYARGGGGINFTTKGAGYEAGKMGESIRGSWRNWDKEWKNAFKSYKVYKTRTYGSIGGQGGGSSALITPTETIIAKGGNGGSAATYGGDHEHDDGALVNATGVKGGNGGSGGAAGTGAPGGARNYDDGTFWSHDGSDGYVKIYKVKQRYTGLLRGDFTAIPDGQVFTVTEGYIPFTVTVHKSETGEVTGTLSPETGFSYANYTVNLRNPEANLTAKLSIDSTPRLYSYSATLGGLDASRLKVQDTLIVTDDTYNIPFTFVVTEINKTLNTFKYTYSPSSGNQDISIVNKEGTIDTGTGARIKVEATESSQKDKDRCYIDFYTRDELIDKDNGEGLHKEYRIDFTDYGYINEGTPNSPYWWEVGSPDIDYGYLLDSEDAKQDYGYITDQIKGEWVEYWIWNRPSNVYPTNHVNLEMKMPIDVDFGEYIDTFVEQFYNISSTVLYIHSIIESFYYGKDTTDSTNPKNNNGASFGIATGAPVMYYEFPVCSNPYIQYTQAE